MNTFRTPTPPPPKKKMRRDKNSREMATRTYVCAYQQHVTWDFTRSILSDSTLKKSKVIPSSKIII